MDWFVRAFVRAAVVWLAIGTTLGLAMLLHPPLLVWRPAHLHMNLLGFVSMMIFGVGYHVFPRFAGVPLRSPRLAGAHWWLANSGLALLAVGFGLRTGAHPAAGRGALAAGGVLSVLGAYAFAWNVWRTIGGAPAPRPARHAALPLVHG